MSRFGRSVAGSAHNLPCWTPSISLSGAVERALHRSSPSLAVLPLATHGSLSQPQRPDRLLQRSRPIAPAPLKSIRGWPTWPGPYSPPWVCFPPVRRQKMLPEVLFCLGRSSQASSNGPESGLIARSARLGDLPPLSLVQNSIGRPFLLTLPTRPVRLFAFPSLSFAPSPFKAEQFPVSRCSFFLPSPLFLRRTDACQLIARLIRHCLYQGLLNSLPLHNGYPRCWPWPSSVHAARQ